MAHVLTRQQWVCQRKRAYLTRKRARRTAKRMRGQHGSAVMPYRCEYCGCFHLGNPRKPPGS